MQYARLGNSELSVSRICLGCMGFGDAGKGQHSWTIDEEHSRKIMKRALDLGVNFFDTAIAYQSGTSEQYVGRAVRDFAKREDVVIATKFLPRTEDEIAAGISGQRHIERMLNTSLNNMGLDYVDLYIYHMWDYQTPLYEIMEGLNNMVKAGKARYIGIPLFFEQLLTMMVGIADTFMISYAGDAAVSGVSLVNMFITFFIYLFTALAAGGAVVVSQYIGRGKRDSADSSASQLLTSAAVISVVLMGATLIWNRPLLQFLFRRVEVDVMDSCVIYLRITALSFLALEVYNAGAALCRSTGRTDLTMKISIAANVINVVGNAVGIFMLHAGVAGVAYPTLIARIFSAVVITSVCFDRSQSVSYQWRNILAWRPEMVRRILKIAVPNGVENGLFQLVKVALSSITALFGTAQIAANGIAQSFWSLAAMIGVTMGPVFITVVGQCIGSGDRSAAEYYFRKLYRMTLVGSAAWNVLIFAVTPVIMLVYPLSDEIIHLVIVLVFIHNLFNAAAFPASGALPNGLRAAGDVRYSGFSFPISCLSLCLPSAISNATCLRWA